MVYIFTSLLPKGKVRLIGNKSLFDWRFWVLGEATPRCCCWLASLLMAFPRHFWGWWRINSGSSQYLGEKICRPSVHNDQSAADLFVTFEFNRPNLQEIWETKESTSIWVSLCICYISFHIYSNSTRVSLMEQIKSNKTIIALLECVQTNRCCITHFS